MRIAMVSEHASPLAALGGADAGGQNVHVAELAAGLCALGHEVTVYTRRDDPDLPVRVPLLHGGTVVHIEAGPPRAVPKDELLPYVDALGDGIAADWARHGDPEVVHAHFWMSGLAALRAARPRGVPVVQTFHALGTVKRRHQGADDPSPAERLELEREVAREADAVVATCTDEVGELARMGVPTSHVRVIPCGVDTGRFSPDGPVADDPPRRARFRLLAVGRMVRRKGFESAIRALADLPDAELVVVGGPPAEYLDDEAEAVRLRELAAELGVAGRLVLTGALPQHRMPALYRSADVVLATPWYEPFGITPLEAAACGRPVVGSAVGGLLDSVADGVSGLLVPPHDTVALTAAAARLLDRPDLASEMGRAGRVRAQERFDWAVVSRATESVLHEVRRPTSDARCETRHWLDEHHAEVESGLRSLARRSDLLRAWGEHLATRLTTGGRLLAAGNGGSAAEAQHLTGELVGRFLRDRRALSGVALTAESASLTAILNDYGPDEVFARQVEAHGRPGDVLVLLSTSGTSSNVLHAAKRGADVGLTVWALTGPAPNPLAGLAHEAITVDAPTTAAVQEVHLVAIHALCAALDASLASRGLLEPGPTCRQAS
ncbi:MAG: glycosyltransferase [Dermatophilaceae bacterium]